MADDEILLSRADDGDECPLCQCGTVEVDDGLVSCRGECGAVTMSQAERSEIAYAQFKAECEADENG
jgi:hypothetical protein